MASPGIFPSLIASATSVSNSASRSSIAVTATGGDAMVTTSPRYALLPPAPLLPQSHLLGELGAGGRVVRRHHRIVGRQIPLLAVGLGRHVVLRAQVALERLELLAVLQAHDMVGRDRALDRHGGLERLGGGLAMAARHPGQGRVALIGQT